MKSPGWHASPRVGVAEAPTTGASNTAMVAQPSKPIQGSPCLSERSRFRLRPAREAAPLPEDVGRPSCGLPGVCLGRRRFAAAIGLLLAGAAIAQTNPPPSAPPTIDAASYQRVVDENLNLRGEQARLTREANDLRRRNASLFLQVQELERKQDVLSKTLAGLQSPEELRAELERTRQARDTLSREVERIRAEAGAFAAAHPALMAPPLSPDSDLYRRLERENADLRAQLSKAVDSTRSASQARDLADRREDQLKAQVEELRAEMGGLRHEVEQATAREKVYKAAIVKIARKAAAYEQALREATTKTVVVGAAAATTTVTPAAPATGVMRQNRGADTSAVEAVRKAIATGRYREAERLCRAGLDREPTNAQLHYNLGVLYDDYLGDPRAAGVQYRKYLELMPGAPDASIVRSWLLDLDLKMK